MYISVFYQRIKLRILEPRMWNKTRNWAWLYSEYRKKNKFQPFTQGVFSKTHPNFQPNSFASAWSLRVFSRKHSFCSSNA
jgi:hypothetical protein